MNQKFEPSQKTSSASQVPQPVVGDVVPGFMGERLRSRPGAIASELVLPEVEGEDIEQESVPQKKRFLLPGWQWLSIFLILLSGGVGFFATSVLLSFNGSNNCNTLFLPLASATTRLYCAQIEAESQTLESYLGAIQMVEGFAPDHPLRAEIDRNIEVWLSQIVALAEVEFQKGRLDEAIALVRDLPQQESLPESVEAQIEAWEAVWQQGETILEQLDKELRASQLSKGVRTAVSLSYLDNRYWATEKYDEAMAKVRLARKELGQLESAQALFRQGGIDNWLQALSEASRIGRKGYAYQAAQNLVKESSAKIIDHSQGLMSRGSWQELLSVLERLPSQFHISHPEIADWRILAQAASLADRGTMSALERAIAQVQRINSNSDSYEQAQSLTDRWQLEMSDVMLIDQGETLARDGTERAYERAIAKLSAIPKGNPRYREAQAQINRWRREIQVSQDRPTLSYAQDLANANRLEAAIREARRIQPGRALYSEAQNDIRQWRNRIERTEDQPIFNEAVALAGQQRFNEAIAVANQISSNRALYSEIQDKVRGWRQKQTAITNLANANALANRNTVTAWRDAIQLVQQIPSSINPESQTGQQSANRWSMNILNIARAQANRSISEAIATARQVPANTAAYNEARNLIDNWQAQLNPTPAISAPPASQPIAIQGSGTEPISINNNESETASE